MELLDKFEEMLKETEIKMKKAIHFYEEQISYISTGRANPNILNKIKIDFYGTSSALNQVSQITNLDAMTLKILPYDKNLIKDIVSKINEANIGTNPTDDGSCIILKFPPLSQERRLELIKEVNKYTEEAKVNIRNIRRNINNSLKKDDFSEDFVKSKQKIIQNLTDKYINNIEQLFKKKEKELFNN